MIATHEIQKINHLYLRAGFGIPLAMMEQTYRQTPDEALEKLLKGSKNYESIQFIKYESREQEKVKKMTREAKKKFRKIQREQLKQLNLFWLNRLAHSPQELRERVTLFWHGHFACRTDHPAVMQHLNNVHRKHGMDDFRTLLLEVSKSPAMLQFLNNKQNKKSHPNENFARELLELFTLGRGSYTERDIKEAARAFTGWSFDQEGNFILRRRKHDEGSKSFMGKTGNFGGEDIIDIVLENKQCAHFLAGKIYRYFVHPQPNPKHISIITDWLYNSDYQIGQTLENIFRADWFYAPENLGVKIKSPIELLAGTFRLLDLEVPTASKPLFRIQNGLGQVLFKPPNVAGWAGDRAWIDSSTLLIRLKLPGLLLGLDFPELKMKGDLTDTFDKWQQKMQKNLELKYNWKKPLQAIPNGDPQTQWAWLAPRLLQQGIDQSAFVKDFLGQARGDEQKKRMLWRLMSLPEWQVC